VIFAVAATLTVARIVAADGLEVPVGLQAALLAKVAEYDRNFAERAGARVQVLIVTKQGNAESTRIASAMQSALGHRDQIAGLPHDEWIAPYTGAIDLVAACRDRHVAVIYFGPGFGQQDVEVIRASLEGVNVLSVASVPQYVERGIVLGFDLISSRPKLLFHLTQARKQHVDMRGEALKLMKVFE